MTEKRLTGTKDTPAHAGVIRIFAPGTEVGSRYEVRGLLGSGGSAVVYDAFDRELNRRVALKVLRGDRMTEATLRRFRREVAVARDADSARLVRVFDIGQSGDSVFLTMERVEGESLRSRLERGPLPEDEAVHVACEVLRALSSLHALGIVHRDVKPGNILLAASGGIKLADFGLARHWDARETRVTETEGIVGTMEYLSPEQATGRGIDARSDLYSFGVLFFEMLTGRVPMEGDTPLTTVLAHLKDDAPDLRTMRPKSPAWLAQVVARLLRKEPRERYASAEAVLFDIERRDCTDGLPGASPVSTRRRPAGRTAVAAGAALALLLAGAYAAWARASSRFDHLVALTPAGLAAVDRSGRTLWKRTEIDRMQAVVLRTGGRDGTAVAVVPWDPAAPAGASRLTLSLLDPQTGAVRSTAALPDGARWFPGFSEAFFPRRLSAVDIAGDGHDDVLVTFFHRTFFPSYAVLYEPPHDRSRLVFVASGYQYFVGAQDVDGDGRRELLFLGPNNRMGLQTGLAAVRVPPFDDADPSASTARWAATPDPGFDGPSPGNLEWYALAPALDPDVVASEAVSVDAARRLVRIRRATGGPFELDFDGFVPGSGSGASRAARQEARSAAYVALRESARLSANGYFSEARDLARKATGEASSAGDRRLEDWARAAEAMSLMRSGRFAEAESSIEELASRSDAPMNLYYEAGRAAHLAGDPSRAISWYLRCLGPGGQGVRGRNKSDFLEGAILAASELRDWSRGREIVDRFLSSYGGDFRTLCDESREFLAWRSGRPALPGAGAAEPGLLVELQRYWRLERRLACGGDGTLARDAEAEASRASESAHLLRMLGAALAGRSGDPGRGLREARLAWEEILRGRSGSIVDRGHLDVAAEHYASVAEAAGERGEAARVRAEAERLLGTPVGPRPR